MTKTIATVTTAELTWIRDLPEVGPAISSLADQEAALLAEVRAIEERRVAAEGRLAALRSSAPARVRAAGWTEAEIGQAKGRYASGGDRFGR